MYLKKMMWSGTTQQRWSRGILCANPHSVEKTSNKPSEIICVGFLWMCGPSSCTAESPWQRHIAFSSNYVLNLEENSNLHLQAELFLPDWVQVAVDCLCSLLGFTHLDGHIRITGTCPVLGLETLGTDDWHTHTSRENDYENCIRTTNTYSLPSSFCFSFTYTSKHTISPTQLCKAS